MRTVIVRAALDVRRESIASSASCVLRKHGLRVFRIRTQTDIVGTRLANGASGVRRVSTRCKCKKFGWPERVTQAQSKANGMRLTNQAITQKAQAAKQE